LFQTSIIFFVQMLSERRQAVDGDSYKQTKSGINSVSNKAHTSSASQKPSAADRIGLNRNR
jgi:hypothetical protein